MHIAPVIVAVCLAVSGCAFPLPGSREGGYAESQLAQNVFRITVDGSLWTSQAEANRKALLRSAEVARRNGYRFFVSSGFAATGSAVLIATNVVGVPSTTMTITCYREWPETTAAVYDVDALLGAQAPRDGSR